MYRIIHLWLEPTPAQTIALAQTQETVNTARNEISAVAYFTATFRLQALADLCVEDISVRLGLSPAMAYRCVASVVASYRGQRHIQQRFHPRTSIPYDRQTFEIDEQAGILTLWTVIGWQEITFATHISLPEDWSQPMLMHVRGTWALLLLVVPDRDGERLREG